jgi:murein DD-endopeptidase MepM/ murein hydrolase activator NlpD
MKTSRGRGAGPRRTGLAGAIVAVLAIAGTARADCSRGYVCVEPSEAGAAIAFRARNLSAYPITLTLAVRVADDRHAPRTLTLPGGAEREVYAVPLAGGAREEWSYAWDWTIGELEPEHDDDYVYRLPFADDVTVRVLQGYAGGFSHRGLERYTVDFDVPVGTPIHAARDGVVAMIEESNDRGCFRRGCGRYANYVVVLHDDGTTGEYYHLAKDGALVEPGERVERGQLIALSGNTGKTTMPHLHFGVYRADTWGRTQSLPVRFETGRGLVHHPRHGQRLDVRPAGR